MPARRISDDDVRRVARDVVRLYGEGAVAHATSQIQKLTRSHAYVAADVMAEILEAIQELQPAKRSENTD